MVADKLVKIVLVPLGEGDQIKALLPGGWERVEMEFSYQELVFVAKLIWPGLVNRRSQQPVSTEGYIVGFEREFLNPLLEFSERRLKNIFFDSTVKKIPAREILLLISCLGKIPLLDNDINWVAGYLNRREFYGLFPVYPAQPKALTRKDEELLNKLMEWYFGQRPEADKNQAREHVLFFLSNLDHFACVLSAALKSDEESFVRVSRMDSYDIGSFVG